MFCRTPKTCTLRLAPRGLTLVEMLIGMAITLVMMAAVVTLFANIGAGVRVQRASMELGSQLRLARARLFKDLAGATCAARPKLPSDDHDDGYLELIEGQYSDKNPSALIDGAIGNGELDYATSIVPSSNLNLTAGDITDGGGLGDYDDILALTVRSESEPFVGRWFNTATGQIETIESDIAEVIWYSIENPADDTLGEPGMRTVYRRVLLIAPWVQDDLSPTTVGGLPADLLNFYRQNDISVRRVNTGGGGTVWVPNTLADLTKRENRFGHFLDTAGALGFPFAINQLAIRATTYPSGTPPVSAFGPLRPYGPPFDNNLLSRDRQGEDVMLNDVLAFDLRVFDPGAPLFENNGLVVEPSDFGWASAPTATISGFGSYVDMYWNHTTPLWQATNTPKTWTPPANAPATQFELAPNARSELDFSTAAIASVTFDTWPYHYESDGLDQDADGVADEGTDGLDTNNADGVDDAEEREAAPPYDVPLRGMQVKIRVYDRDSRQIREATVTRNFVPQ